MAFLPSTLPGAYYHSAEIYHREMERIFSMHWLCVGRAEHPIAFAQPGFDPEDAVAFWDRTNQQDWDICERTQRGIRSRVYTPGPSSPAHESLLPAFHRQVLKALGAGPAESP